METVQTAVVDRPVRAASEPAPEALLPLTWQFVVGVALGVPAFLLLVRQPITLQNWRRVGINYVVDVTVTVAITGVLLFLYAYPLPRLLARVESKGLRGVIHTATIFGAVMGGMKIAGPVIHWFCRPEDLVNSIHHKVTALVAAAVVVMGALAYERLQLRARQSERRVEEAQQAALRAQLEALQARTNPHFLFNSLNTVASLIPTDPVCAEATLERLSGLFRYSLEGARKTSVRLADEISATTDYLDVEALRLGTRLGWDLCVDNDLDDVRLPPLTLQPLVENAVVHAIAPRKRGGHITIEARGHDDHVVLSVTDDGPGPGSAPPSSGTGTALSDLERRLAVAYGDSARVERQRVESGGYRIEIRLPRSTA